MPYPSRKPEKLQFGRNVSTRALANRPLQAFVTIPTAPATFDPLAGSNPFHMLGNGPDPTLTVNGGRPVGDCGFVMTVNANIVTGFLTSEQFNAPSSDEVVATYLAYDGGKDFGVQNAQLLPYWRTHGLWGNKIAAHGQVNHFDFDEAMDYAYAFGGLCTGIIVTADMETATQNGAPWEKSTTPFEVLGGHDVFVFGRLDQDTGVLATWGRRQIFTRGWWETHVQEADAVITYELNEKKGDTLGLDLPRLVDMLEDSESE